MKSLKGLDEGQDSWVVYQTFNNVDMDVQSA